MGQSTPNEVTAQKAIPEIMADVIDDDSDSLGSLIKSEDFSDDDETKACEQILDNLFEIEQDIKPTILDTAWEETFHDLFPDLGDVLFEEEKNFEIGFFFMSHVIITYIQNL